MLIKKNSFINDLEVHLQFKISIILTTQLIFVIWKSTSGANLCSCNYMIVTGTAILHIINLIDLMKMITSSTISST